VKFMAGGDAPTSGNAITGVGNQGPGGAPAAIDTDIDGPSIAVDSLMQPAPIVGRPPLLPPAMVTISPGNPATILGHFGTLTLDSAGNYTYTQNSAVVSTLNLSTGSVQDQFKYTITDGSPSVNSTITINIGVTNAPPVANPDINATVEGATTPVTGNAITKPVGINTDLSDTDITVNGKPLLINGAVAGDVASGPQLAAGGLGNLVGNYGTLTLNADGSYSYQVNNSNANVIALNPNSPLPLKDYFTYNVTDQDGGVSNNNTTITINITGINNPPVAVDDVKSILANQLITNGQAIIGGVPGDNADSDPDLPDANKLTVCGVEAGIKTAVGNAGVGVPIIGTYGTLTLAANGSYTYTPNAAAAALALGTSRTDTFAYCLQDPAGAKDVGLITINLTGVNEPPTANPERLQLNKASPPKSGNAITGLLPGELTDTDPDRTPNPDILTVQGVGVGTLAGTLVGGVNTPIVGAYGTLVLMADGSYTYTLDPAKTAALAKTDTVSDVFTYTINDGQGPTSVSTTTITFDISGANQPPAGADKLIPLPEDTPRPLTPADFGFTDPDVGDTFKAVRIVSLPDPAGGKLFFNGTEVVLVGGFLQIPFADIGKLEFRPAPNANTANLTAPPGFNFQVCDNDGAFDPTPNRITFTLIPANDPPVASQSVFGMDASATGTALKLDNAQLLSGIKPIVTDPDRPADVLTVMIDVVPPASQGQYFVGTSLIPLKAGDVLTEAQLQQLCFKPNPAISGTPGADGRIPTQPLMFTVMDGKGGQDATGTIQVNVRPAPALPPVVVPPVVITPPSLPPVVFAPLLPITTRAVNEAAKLRAADDIRFSPIEAASDLDAGGYFDGGRINSVWNRERVAGVQVVAEEAPKSPVKEIDCAPIKPKEKPKLKVVKRSVFADGVKDAPNKNFSEQLKAAQKRFKAPVRTVPKPEIRKDC
jgi:VCBS repeat-containing protein